MGIKIKLITGLFFLLVFSAGVLPVFSDDNIVRVGLTDNKFQNVLKQEVTVYGTAECDICDKETRKIIANTAENTEIIIKNGEVGLDLTIKGKTTTLRDFVIVCPRGVLGVKDLTRKGKPALYHGAFEVVQHPDRKGFYLVNLVETKCL